MITYDSFSIYIDSATTLTDKIAKIDAALDALMGSLLKSAETANIEEYQLNDGQTIIRTRYRDAVQVSNTIAALERMKQMYVNRLNGRTMRLVDSKNIINRWGC